MIETERLVLRPLTTADVDLIVELHADPQVHRFVPHFTPDQALERLTQVELQWSGRGHGLCAVESKETGEFLGRCGLHYWRQFDEIEIGWVLRPGAWGNGYATEAARACAEWGFDRLDADYFTAMIDPANQASLKVAERVGFSQRRMDTLFGKKITVLGLEREAAAGRA
ncbi:GNAT family N-acetyltransferase [Streptomyces meridianus]|uniref:GNAT family N-acetyltransferase n=1 Tax=Streptomyces meridianus TaxID=2938945 RepID=A0ABT0X2H3_9ACTN|nr:GNAT family N-acetyltransferase [Streptomyces meridianus]MCM2576745.1 GNAT family N-acetyltransferase [Streptomyces meridianus]